MVHRPFLRAGTLPALALAGGALLLIAAEFVYLRGRRADREAAAADRLVAARVETAEAHLAHGEWDQALPLLHEALAAEKARNRDLVPPVLLRAQRDQATALFERARAALDRKDGPAALALLRAYREDPHAPDPEAAACLQEDLEQAMNDAGAVQLLSRWSDASLTLFVESGWLDAEDWVGDAAAGEVFKDTLRRHLAAEKRKREEQRALRRREEERRMGKRAAQEARIRSSAAYRDLVAFLAASREELAEEGQLAGRRERALEQFLSQIPVADDTEREGIRARLTAERREANRAFADLVARRRAEIKQAFRRVDFDPDDAAVFDQRVDQEMDALLKERGDF
jgi:hypothetical protein